MNNNQPSASSENFNNYSLPVDNIEGRCAPTRRGKKKPRGGRGRGRGRGQASSVASTADTWSEEGFPGILVASEDVGTLGVEASNSSTQATATDQDSVSEAEAIEKQHLILTTLMTAVLNEKKLELLSSPSLQNIISEKELKKSDPYDT